METDTVFTRLNELPYICCEDSLACECSECSEWRIARLRAAAMAWQAKHGVWDTQRPPAPVQQCETVRPARMAAR